MNARKPRNLCLLVTRKMKDNSTIAFWKSTLERPATWIYNPSSCYVDKVARKSKLVSSKSYPWYLWKTPNLYFFLSGYRLRRWFWKRDDSIALLDNTFYKK